MYEEFEGQDELERDLTRAMERRPAPPSLKRKVMERRGRRRAERNRSWTVMWQRMAATAALAAAIGAVVVWRGDQERKKSEAAREQVMTALRITSHALDEVRQQLAENGEDADK